MNSWHSQQLKFALGIGGFMSFYGFAGLIVWLLGEKMGFPVGQRIVVIALILLTMPFAMIVGYVATRRSKNKKEKEKEADAGQAEASEKTDDNGSKPKKLGSPTGNYEDLTKGVEEVVNFLKGSNLGEVPKDAVYSLPWYIVAGTPKSGKSSLVLGSNLNFQRLPSQRQSELKVIRPTRNVDWRITSDAVFVDTAGRYQSEGVDQDEWAALLETIQKYRSNRPIDGLVVTANAERILNADEREIEEMAKVMRSRLDEAMQRLKVRFPVYLVFTHADAIEGFRDSFSTSKKEGQNLVWGATIPLEKAENGHSLFDEEYELLLNSVMKRRLMRLSAPFPPVRQLRIFNFPLHFSAARRKLGAFVSALFRPNPFSENPFLRGFYFTAIPASRAPAEGEKTMGGAPQTVGAAYFTEKFFRDVLLRDKDLVKTFQEQRQKPPILGWLLTVSGVVVTLLFLILAGVSLATNKQMLDDAQKRALAVLNITKEDRSNLNRKVLDKSPEEATREITTLENLRQMMVVLDTYEREGAPFYMRMGFYSGDEILRTKLLPVVYYTAIERRFKGPTIKRLEEDLRKFAASQPVSNPNQLSEQEEETLNKHYDLLKAYLMFSGDEKYRQHADPTFLSATLKDYWFNESKLPEGLKDLAHKQLEFYARQVDRDDFPRVPINDLEGSLVADVRKKLSAFPPYQRYYKRKVSEISKDLEPKLGPMNVDGILARNGADVGFLEGSYTVPGAYTLEGYKQMNVAILQSAVSAEDWVMGEQGKTLVAESTDAGKIRDRYFRDYADHWQNFVRGVRVKPYNRDTAKEALSSFSSNNSPMKVLLQTIARNTNLSAKPKSSGWWQSIKDTVGGWFENKVELDTGGNSAVEREFRPLFAFVEEVEKDKKVPVEDYQAAIGELSTKFSGFSSGEINDLASLQEEEKNKKFPELRRVNGRIDNLLKSFKDTPSGQALTELLRQPVGNLNALLGADANTQLAKRWTEEILPKAREAEKGFPFEQTQADADLTKLKEYLSPTSGILSKFYEERLKRYFEGNPGQLKLKNPSEVPFSDEFIAYLNKAFTLRQALFGAGDNPKFEYNFELLNTKDALVEVTIDGTVLSSAEKPSSTVTFPAATGAGNGVIIRNISLGGPTFPSPTPVPANAAPTNPSVTDNSAGSGDERPFPGPWGLFRFFDASNPQKQADSSYLLNYKLKSGKTLSAKITPSGGDPFDKKIYELRAPQAIFK